ncbi:MULTISPECIES: hypothetical protein [unclassified Methylobacterium]|uniref:hypothetical protein n=1 Tax=unclassified Methylobacterium TaxID=2615210 RepID=UPI00039AA561|nr:MULTISPECIES: hypothetical protein [Methylobacterium]WFT81240.1 hypothetical protein QA634_04885 [Methylobacterium nodulans]
MRARTLLPFIALLALTACKDEKKADTTNTANPPAATTAAPASPPTGSPAAPTPPSPATPTNPSPATKP